MVEGARGARPVDRYTITARYRRCARADGHGLRESLSRCQRKCRDEQDRLAPAQRPRGACGVIPTVHDPGFWLCWKWRAAISGCRVG